MNKIRVKIDDSILKLLLSLLLIPGFIILIWLAAEYLPPGIDWHETFYPTANLVLHGKSPYGNWGYRCAPWAIIPLLPLALLPETYGRAVMFLVSLAAFTIIAKRLGARPLAIVFILLSPPVIHGLLNANIDWLAAIGFILPPQIGIFFVCIKPQMGIAVGFFWLVDIWRGRGFKEVLRVFWPFSAALALSFILFGFWPFTFNRSLHLWWNASLWPLSLPIALALTVTAIRKRSLRYAMAASPGFSPYILFHSYIGVLLAIVHLLPETIAAVLGLWIVIGIQGFGG